MRVYLDVSCLNRPFDDQRQVRVRLEAEAIIQILALADNDRLVIVSSEIAEIEISANKDSERRRRVQSLLPDEKVRIRLTAVEFERANQLSTMGLKPADALHVACAETLNSDVLLTCDDRLCRIAERGENRIRVRIGNPVDWLREFPNASNT